MTRSEPWDSESLKGRLHSFEDKELPNTRSYGWVFGCHASPLEDGDMGADVGDPMANANPLCGTDWGRLLAAEFAKQYWSDLVTFVKRERSQYPELIYPPANEVFRALELTWCQ